MDKRVMAGMAVAVLAAGIGLGAWYRTGQATPAPVAAVSQADPAAPILAGLQDTLAAYRKIIVLFADEKGLAAEERDVANQVGQALFHENRQRVEDLETALDRLVASGDDSRFTAVGRILDYVGKRPWPVRCRSAGLP